MTFYKGYSDLIEFTFACFEDHFDSDYFETKEELDDYINTFKDDDLYEEWLNEVVLQELDDCNLKSAILKTILDSDVRDQILEHIENEIESKALHKIFSKIYNQDAVPVH